MRPSQVFRASHYKPMIKFLGSRKNLQHRTSPPFSSPPSSDELTPRQAPHNPSPHPCAPSEIRESFPSFLSRLNASSSAPASKQDTRFKPSGKPVDFENFWEAPGYLWRTKEVGELEMDAVMVNFIRSLLAHCPGLGAWWATRS
ncbi:hypothetical protein L198_08145 [Cryptococcus wingfieldii CBS 7118]|uniref:Uncharacterized protein n=1 Tax=Cryptococcus wingfieldii CBS 7118 TaxID=1295528 RepID=A0A1E3HHM5_9TREE|nr:hypothetical protein L198_08145 [Cryptococcus wingfieldii CBS 7118]ODN75615.1 hypothetical protein L198_08145 [Cryptococcus wingfieldii CBS 7118]